jgi:hypothetical protein
LDEKDSPDFGRVFHRSNWTQEQLAKKEGTTQRWIGRRLLFGRFLDFRPTGLNAETLTERNFRSYWERAPKCGGNERARFNAVISLMTNETKSLAPVSDTIWPGIIEKFGDGKWHGSQEIADALVTSSREVEKALLRTGSVLHSPSSGLRRGLAWFRRRF